MLLKHSPKLDEALLQSSRFQDITQQVRLNLVSLEEAQLTKNQIRWGMLELLRHIETQHETTALSQLVDELENQSDNPGIEKEMQDAISILKSKNVLIGSSITSDGPVHIGDQVNTSGHHNIVIQGVTDSTIQIQVDGEMREINKRLDDLQELLHSLKSSSFQTANKPYHINTVSPVNFEYIIAKAGHQKTLPLNVAEDIISDDNRWVDSLRQELRNRQRVAVGNKPSAIFQHYGWLIEEFLRKMETPAGRKNPIRRISFMAEAFQSSLRYLCYIQLAQILKTRNASAQPALSQFLSLKEQEYLRFDYLNLLLIITAQLRQQKNFVPQIIDFVDELTDTQSDLYGTALFLESKRDDLLDGKIHNTTTLTQLLNEYLTGLVFWLRKISFLARYRLVSIKDINLKYRLGTTRNFVHIYGELHGLYNEAMLNESDYGEMAIEDLYTFNQSVLLFNGSNVEACLEDIGNEDTYISLSPLIIDQSVFSDKPTQTPEIYYLTGYSSRKYQFAQYKNELPIGEQKELTSNKTIQVKATNIKQPKFDELFEQMEQIFKPFKNPMA